MVCIVGARDVAVLANGKVFDQESPKAEAVTM